MRVTHGMQVPNYFSPDKTEYRCKDPYKVALLRGMGAEIVKRVVENPRSVIFVLSYPHKSETDNLVVMVKDIHGDIRLDQKYGVDPRAVLDFHKDAMNFIRSQRTEEGGSDERSQ